MKDTDTNAGNATKSVRVTIEGRVQGVCYRAWTVEEARARGLDGWVRNRANGDVEALFSGPARAVNGMLEACWQGPPAAQVRCVTPVAVAAPGTGGFRQAPTE